MDSTKLEEPTRFVMSLDTLDLALLPTFCKKFKSNSMWSTNALNSNDYFEFHVQAKADVCNDDDSSLNNDTSSVSEPHQNSSNLLGSTHLYQPEPTLTKDIELTTCHICDIEVPVAYLSDHENSLKHVAHLKITDIALQRVRQHMMRKNLTSLRGNDKMHFCGPCVSVIKIDDKHRHEKSKEHKQAMAIDRLLNELVALYTGEGSDDNMPVINEAFGDETKVKSEVNRNTDNDTVIISDMTRYISEESGDNISAMNRKFYKTKVTSEVGRNTDNDTVIISDTTQYIGEESGDNISAMNRKFDKTKVTSEVGRNIDNDIITISDIKARLDELETKTMGEYIKLIDECNDDKTYTLSVEGNDVKIMQHKGTVIVAMDNFNGFVRMEQNFILCILCKIIIEDEKVHRLSETHISNVSKPFKDYHCLRNLENSSSHCVICNKIVSSFDLHVLCDETHTDLLEKALVKHAKNDTSHSDSTINGLNTKVFTNSLNKNGNEIKTTNDSKHSLVNRTKTVDNKSDGTKQFIKTDPIQAKVDRNEIIADNGIYFCKPCNISMHINNVDSHLNGNKHAMNRKSNSSYLMKAAEESSDLICKVCNIFTEDDVHQIEEHVKTSYHISKYKEILKTNHIVAQNKDFHCKPCNMVLLKKNELYHIEKVTHQEKLDDFKVPQAELSTVNSKTSETVVNDVKIENKFTYYCNICNVYIPNNRHNIKTHNNGHQHIKNVNRSKSATPDSVQSSITKLHYHMEATDNEKNLMCKICKAAVPNIDENITEHVNGKKHDANFKSMLAANCIEAVGEELFCNHCGLSIKEYHLFSHINQGKHKKIVKNYEPTSIDAAKMVPETDLQPIATTSGEEQNNFDIKEHKKIVNNNEPTSIDAAKMVPETDLQPIATTSKQNFDINDKLESDKTYLKFKHHFIEKEDKEWLQCNVCLNLDLKIRNTAEDILNHATSEEHVEAYKMLILTNLTFETEDGSYYCGQCDCMVPQKGEIQHVKGLRHAGNYDKFEKYCDICKVDTTGDRLTFHLLSVEHVIGALKNQAFLHYCEYCDTLMQKVKVDEHSRTCDKLPTDDEEKSNSETTDSKHNSVTAKLDLRFHMESTENEKNLRCKICKVVVPNSDDGLIDHVYGKKHKANYESILDANGFCYVKKGLLFCDHCKVHVKDQNLFTHIKQYRHKKFQENFGRIIEINAPKAPNIIESPISQANTSDIKTEWSKPESNLTLELDKADVQAKDLGVVLDENDSDINSDLKTIYLKNKHHFIDKEDLLQCKVCYDIEISNTTEEVATHITNDAHMKLYKNLITSNLIFETEEGIYYCAICDCLVPHKGEVHHMKGLKHLTKYTSFDKYCDICKMDTTDVLFHLISRDHVTRALKKQTLLHYCEYCNTLMQKIKNEEHSSNCHRLTVRDKICFCTVCDPYLPGMEGK